MIPPREVIQPVLAEPFRPFRIHLASGRTGRTTMTVYAPPENDAEGPERWEKLAYVLVESIAPLNAPAIAGGNY